MPYFDDLICPVCRQKFTLTNKSVRCPKGHTFDVARQGYLNLHLSPVKTKYTKDLYQARQHLFRIGVFDPLVTCLSTLLHQHRGADVHSVSTRQNMGTYPPSRTYCTTSSPTPPSSLSLLDVGCGEGSLLTAITQTLSKYNLVQEGLGIDLCKDAIKIAARAYPSLSWCVADLAHLPIADSTQDIILNILAPANYAEFKRLLKPGGTLVKVMPGPDHFKEIRQALTSQKLPESPPTPQCTSHNPRHIPSSTPDTPPHVLANPLFRSTEAPPSMAHPYFTITQTQRLTYDVPAAQTIEHFFRMSPLSWHTLPEKKEAALSGRLQKIRLDYIIALAQIVPCPR